MLRLIDKDFRTMQFARVADRELAAMDADSRSLLEAYARGVNHFIEQHRDHLPLEFSLLAYKPQPWRAADTLTITAYMYRTLTNVWENELDRATVEALVRTAASRRPFAQASRNSCREAAGAISVR